jgi:Holliday junction resolvase RusA-like endonuclease
MKAVLHRRTRRAIVVADHRAELQSWRALVSSAAMTAAQRTGLHGVLEGPLLLIVRFQFLAPVSRPKQIRTPQQHALWAYPVRRPDLSKAIRAVEDALTGVVYRDDAQIVSLHTTKEYAAVAGARIALETLQPASTLPHPAARAPEAVHVVSR